MFSIDTYIRRRQELKKLVGKGVIVLFGNNDSPANYPANAYAPMRQDSSFLYYFGLYCGLESAKNCIYCLLFYYDFIRFTCWGIIS